MGCGASKKSKVDEKAHKPPQSDRSSRTESSKTGGAEVQNVNGDAPPSAKDPVATLKDEQRRESRGSVDEDYLMVLEEMDRLDGDDKEKTDNKKPPTDSSISNSKAAATTSNDKTLAERRSEQTNKTVAIPSAVDTWSTYSDKDRKLPSPSSLTPVGGAVPKAGGLGDPPTSEPPKGPPAKAPPVLPPKGNAVGKGKLFAWAKKWRGNVCDLPAKGQNQDGMAAASVDLQSAIRNAKGAIGEDECRAAVDAINESLDSVLQEGLHSTEADASESGLMGNYGVRQVRALFDVFLRHVTSRGQKPETIRFAVHASVECVSLLAQARPQSETALTALNHLVLLLLPGLEGDINQLISEEEAQARRTACIDKFEELGVRSSILNEPAWMSARTKALFLFLDIASHGQKRLVMMVTRGHVINDARKVLAGEKDLPLLSTHKLFPFYRTPDGKVEAGEGHGPRKEFFTLLSEEFAALYGAAQPRDLVCESESGSSVLQRVSGSTQGIIPGMRIEFTSETASDGLVLSRTVVDVDTDTIRVDALFEHSLKTVPGSVNVRDKAKPLFDFNDTAGVHYYGHSSSSKNRATSQLYEFVGWAIAMTLINRVPLDLRLPSAFFHRLLDPEWVPSEQDLLEFDPGMKSTIDNIKGMKKSDLAAVLEMEDLPASLSVPEYIAHLANQTLIDSSSWQADAVRKGFSSALSFDTLSPYKFTGDDLVSVVCAAPDDPSADFFIKDYFRVVQDDEWNEYPEFTQMLWHIIDHLEPADKRLFLKFVTGRDRLPLAMAEVFRLEIPFAPISRQDHEEILSLLPQSHTCSNTLEMPNYWQALLETQPDLSHDQVSEQVRAKIMDKLILAIHGSRGYDLDDGAADRGDESKIYKAPIVPPSTTPLGGIRGASETPGLIAVATPVDEGVMSFDTTDMSPIPSRSHSRQSSTGQPRRGMKMNTSSFSILPTISTSPSPSVDLARNRRTPSAGSRTSPGPNGRISKSPSFAKDNRPLPSTSPAPRRTVAGNPHLNVAVEDSWELNSSIESPLGGIVQHRPGPLAPVGAPGSPLTPLSNDSWG